MSCEIIKMYGSNLRTTDYTVAFLKDNIKGNLLYESWKGEGESCLAFLKFEKLYMRNNNYVELSILFTEVNGVQTAEIIGCCGGSGFFNINMGTNSSFAHEASKILYACGYEVIESEEVCESIV